MNLNDYFTAGQISVFEIYEKQLAEKNKIMNLTAISGKDEVFEKHFIDSVLPLRFFSLKDSAAVIDVGSGAGFPGVPIKIVRPDISLTCIDSTMKKIDFLRGLGESIGTDFSAVCVRAEEAGHSDIYRESFDCAVSRAVAPLPVLAELCLPLVKIGGVFIAMKGEKESINDAESAISILGARVLKCEKYELPSGDKRQLFIIEKLSETPKKYPREFAKIKKQPL
jgi:16S rRNA (guanine(527)-N(7))-methyltransferase RsmG